jgi:hypothetical protein
MLADLQIVYFQTVTDCQGHCRYCPFDDIYGQSYPRPMDFGLYVATIDWLSERGYSGRIGFLLHCEPTLDPFMKDRVKYTRKKLKDCTMEAATNGLYKNPDLKYFDVVDVSPAGKRTTATSRAGNCRYAPEMASRPKLLEIPCVNPVITMPIAANGDVLLCCQDWRHEAVVGTVADLDAARINQLKYAKKAAALELEICQDCMAGRTAEEVGERLGKRSLDAGRAV